MTFSPEKIEIVKTKLADAKQIAIVAHKSPDGDSIGSSVGLYQYLRKKGYNVKICHPDPAPYFLKWIRGVEDIVEAENNRKETVHYLQAADLIFCLDFNDMGRTGMLKDVLRKASAYKIMIDHHLHPSDEFDLVFSETTSCSTAQLIVDFIIAMEDEQLLDDKIGEPLYCGIMTDSGSFRFPSVTAHTHEVVATLMKYGVQPYVVHESVYDTNSFDKLKLRAFAINQKTELWEAHQTIIISLSAAEMERFNYRKGDTEGLVNEGLSIAGVKKAIFLRESDGIIKISFRSKGQDNPVNEMASKYFSGGGHANAAGGKWEGTMEEAIERIKKVLPQYDA